MKFKEGEIIVCIKREADGHNIRPELGRLYRITRYYNFGGGEWIKTADLHNSDAAVLYRPECFSYPNSLTRLLYGF